MKKTVKSLFALLVVTGIVTSLSSFTASASGGAENPSPKTVTDAIGENDPFVAQGVNQKWQLSTGRIANKSIWAYPKATAKLNGVTQSADARIINGEVYIAVRAFFENSLGMSVTYYSASKTLEIQGSGFIMNVIDGSCVTYVNSRTLFSMTPSVIMTNGRMYAPLAPIAKSLGLSYSVSGNAANLNGSMNPIKSGNVYYDADAVYWLARIISAESSGESLLGQIAVGNVVLNRVKSPLYPNTIWGVIFDRKYGVQFSPVGDGRIYNTPTSSAITAARICLEGYVVAPSSLFFLNPAAATSSWITQNRTYVFSIGKHDFYK